MKGPEMARWVLGKQWEISNGKQLVLFVNLGSQRLQKLNSLNVSSLEAYSSKYSMWRCFHLSWSYCSPSNCEEKHSPLSSAMKTSTFGIPLQCSQILLYLLSRETGVCKCKCYQRWCLFRAHGNRSAQQAVAKFCRQAQLSLRMKTSDSAPTIQGPR